MLRSVALLTLLTLLSLPLTALAAQPRITGQQAKRIDADVTNIMRRTGTPSATILVAEHGYIVSCRSAR